MIVTYSRSWQALAAIRSLGRRGVEVIAADEYAITPGGMSRHALASFQYPGPGQDSQAFLDGLSAAVDEYAPGPGVPYVLMPIHQESYLIAAARERFEGRIAVPLASVEQFDLVRHKGRLARYAEARGFAVPKTWTPANLEELEAQLASITYPAFLKVPASAAGVGIQRVESAEELRQRFSEMIEETGPGEDQTPIVQEAVDGEDLCVTGLFNQGSLRASMTYRNVLTFPRVHGPGVVRETVSAPKLERLAAKLLGEIRWHGMAQVDFRWTGKEEDPAYLIEINPRFFGGLLQSIESGVDYPWLLFQMAVNGDVAPPDNVAIGNRTEAPVAGLIATLSEFLEREPDLGRLESAWSAAKRSFERGHAWSAARELFAGLTESVDVEGRLERVRELLEQNESNVSMLFDADDPLPVLGLVYPLAVFVRHGKLSADVLSSVKAEQ
ncbi:MAG TPA: ATP-grasp domain-containing protein [Polyangiaceae bacterium]|nr:ATP-grasp domain-containing protein [Polyangiaceae bacterium]